MEDTVTEKKPPLKIFKLVVPTGSFRPDPDKPEIQYAGYGAVVLAENLEQAKEMVRTAARERSGRIDGWVKVADISVYEDLTVPTFILWSQV